MGLPPSLAGAVQLTLAWALPARAVAAVGTAGTVGALAGAVTLRTGACALSSRLANEIGVALAEVRAKATRPLPVTSEVTLKLTQLPAVMPVTVLTALP